MKTEIWLVQWPADHFRDCIETLPLQRLQTELRKSLPAPYTELPLPRGVLHCNGVPKDVQDTTLFASRQGAPPTLSLHIFTPSLN